jgi:hypothetical protein
VGAKENVKEHTAIIRRNVFKSNLVEMDVVKILDALKVLRLRCFLYCASWRSWLSRAHWLAC